MNTGTITGSPHEPCDERLARCGLPPIVGGVGTPKAVFSRSHTARKFPCQRFSSPSRASPHDSGTSGSLLLSRRGLPPLPAMPVSTGPPRLTPFPFPPHHDFTTDPNPSTTRRAQAGPSRQARLLTGHEDNHTEQ